MRQTLLFIIVYLISNFHSSASLQPNIDCIEWFGKGGVKAGTQNCELECTTLMIDMKTFICPQQCEILCKKEKKANSLGQLVYYPGLTPAEKKLVAEHPKEAVIVFVQKTRAEWSSRRNFPEQNLNDESDAFRHFIWSGLLTKELGKKMAKKFLDAHEENRLQKLSEKEMDIFNNKSGRDSAETLIKDKKWSLKNLEREGLQALKLKKLKVLQPSLKIQETSQ